LRNARSTGLVLAGFCYLFALAGCGGPPQTFEVKGTVKGSDQKNVSGYKIRFQCVDGNIREGHVLDGEYTVYGVPKGKVQIALEAEQMMMMGGGPGKSGSGKAAPVEDLKKKKDEINKSNLAPEIKEQMLKDLDKQKKEGTLTKNVPTKYNNFNSSGLTAVIEPNKENVVNLDLVK
jgi:hypothetical protein